MTELTQEELDNLNASNEAIAARAADAAAAGQAVPLPPVKVAFVIDGKLVDVLHTDSRLGAILLSQPVVLDVTDTYDVEHPWPIGSSYDEETSVFTPPIFEAPTE